MSRFDKRVADQGVDPLCAVGIDIVQVSVGLRCNQECKHCHLACSPERGEMMEWTIMEGIIETARSTACRLVDITGGSPELNPSLQEFITALRAKGVPVQVRTNLTVLAEPGLESMPEFYRKHGVRLVASMPCYLEKNVRAQRGKGVYEKSIDAIRRLNSLGYASEAGLQLDLVYNPGGPFIPPEQGELETAYRRELGERFGIVFSHLLTIANMPIGRFYADLCRQGKERKYVELLRESFNPKTVENLMCRHQLSIGWDGTLYDCDFNLALGLPVDHGAPDHIGSFEPSVLRGRRIVTGEHCFGCTAGSGSSCGGALV